MNETNNTSDNANFEALLEQSLPNQKRLEPGQKIKAEVVSFSKEYVFIHLNGKSEGIIEKKEFLDDEENLRIKEGDFVEAHFIAAKNGELFFSTKIAQEEASLQMLENAYRASIPVEGKIEKEIKGGFEVSIGKHAAFCPFSQLGIAKEEQENIIGKVLTFKIITYKDGGRSLTLSHLAVLEEERKNALKELSKTLSVGQKVSVEVKSLHPFGAFVDLKGIKALLPISEIRFDRIDKIEDLLSLGETIEVAILNLDWENDKISVSKKALLGDPWENLEDFAPESIHTGTITRIAGFGVFVRLKEGLEGLLHNSEIRKDERGNREVSLKKGDTIEVIIKSVDSYNKKIALKQGETKEEIENAKEIKKHQNVDDAYNPFASLLKK